MRQCTKCKEWKEETEFHKNKKGRDGLCSWCKVCANRNAKEYHHKRKADPEYQSKLKQRRKKFRVYQREYYKKYYAENRDDLCEYQRQYYKDNREECLKKRIKYTLERRKDPDFRKQNKLKYLARKKVNHQVESGAMPAASDLPCEICGEQAREYHHESYEPEYWLDVIPLCAKCHGIIHRKELC